MNMTNNSLYHHGIKGQKWGKRRFQNKDGSLTPAGKQRYITVAQASRNADRAAKDARKKSFAESRATDSGIGSYRRAANKASAAEKEARRDSIAKDKAHNQQLRYGKEVASKKQAYQDAKKAYSQAYNKADSRRLAAFSPSKKQRDASTKLWEDAYDKAEALNKAQSEYRTAKHKRRTSINTVASNLRKKASVGEKFFYNEAVHKKAAKYIVDNNMSMSEATKKAKGEAWRNTAIIIGAIGAVSVANRYMK